MVNPFEETRRAGIESLPKYEEYAPNDNVALGAALYNDPGFREYTSGGDPNSWFQSGVAPYVLHDIASQRGNPETQAYVRGIDWRNITHPQSYKMRDEITEPVYKIPNLRQGYLGVGGNIGNLGWDVYQDIDDERTHADLSLGMPLWGGNLQGGFDWNSEDDITRALIEFSLPF